MKELIAISAHCPTPEKRQILLELLLSLQPYRENYDLLIASHHPISETFCELVDFVIYDRFNDVIEDFDLTNSFTFENSNFLIKSSLVFSKSTHPAVYSIICNSINFAKFNGYRNLHYVEYDLLPANLEVIKYASKILIDHDSFLVYNFDAEWTHGPYFSFRVDNLEIESPMTREKIIRELRDSNSKHTEHIFTRLISKDRIVYYHDVNKLTNQLGKIDRVDSHNSRGLNWVIPIYNTQTGNLDLFIYNEHGGNHNILISVNGVPQIYPCPETSYWTTHVLCEFFLPIKIQVYIESILTKSVEITHENVESFKNKNVILFKNHD